MGWSQRYSARRTDQTILCGAWRTNTAHTHCLAHCARQCVCVQLRHWPQGADHGCIQLGPCAHASVCFVTSHIQASWWSRRWWSWCSSGYIKIKYFQIRCNLHKYGGMSCCDQNTWHWSSAMLTGKFWSSSFLVEDFTDTLQYSIQIICKVSRWTGKFPDDFKSVWII